MKDNTEKIALIIGGSRGPRVKLVCFPEFSIGGCYSANSATEEVKKYEAVTIPGPETDIMAQKARQHQVYIAAVNHET